MLTNITIHSTFSDFFPSRKLQADLSRYEDLPRYLGAMHPKFEQYVKKIYLGEVNEGYMLLDKNLKSITTEDLMMKVIKPEDEFYVVPAIVGGGGKRMGTLLKFAAIAAAAVIAAPYVASMFGGGAAVTTGSLGFGGATGDLVARGVMGSVASQGAAATSGFLGFSSFSSFGASLAVNAGLALVTSLFTQAPQSINQTDQAVRQNNMFGSLRNTIDSGVTIPLVYGMHRVAGQFVSGYVDSINHSKEEIVKVSEQF